MEPPRLVPGREFPPYAFLPGRDPHPTRHPEGHSFTTEPEAPLTWRPAEEWSSNEEYLYGIDLYNHGYLWEAHEAWEGLWHPSKPDALQADHLQGLIQCSAAALKVRMGQPRGLIALAKLGTERLERVAQQTGGSYMGLDLSSFVEQFRSFAASEPHDAEGRPLLLLEGRPA